VHEGAIFEEVTVAWGTVPVASLALATAAVKVRLTGGSPDAPTEISSADVRRRSGGWRAMARAVTGGDAGATLTLQPLPLAKLKPAERQVLGRLRLTVVLPYTHAPLVETARRVAAEQLLASTRSHARASGAGAQPLLTSAPLAVFAALAGGAPGSGGGAALGAAAESFDALLAAAGKTKGPKDGAAGAGGSSGVGAGPGGSALAEAMLRAWPATAAAAAPRVATALVPPMHILVARSANTPAAAALAGGSLDAVTTVLARPFSVGEGVL
jgi:hypothetical protein